MSEEKIDYQKEKRKQEIGERISFIRNKLEMTREELAEKSGITPNYLYEIESGKKVPSVIIFDNICKALGVSTEQILNPKEGNQLKDLIQEISIDFFKLSDTHQQLIKDNIRFLANKQNSEEKKKPK